MVPVSDPDCRNRLLEILKIYFQDNTKAHQLQANGKYKRLKRGNKASHRSQEILYQQACEAAARSTQMSRTVFLPHQAPGNDSNRM
jgi:polyphosphate kinase